MTRPHKPKRYRITTFGNLRWEEQELPSDAPPDGGLSLKQWCRAMTARTYREH